MEPFVWLEARIALKERWRSVTTGSGGLCAMTTGLTIRLKSSAKASASHLKVVPSGGGAGGGNDENFVLRLRGDHSLSFQI